MNITSEKQKAKSLALLGASNDTICDRFLKPVIGSLLCLMLLLFSREGQAQILTLDSVLSKIEQRNPMLQEYDEKVKAIDAYSLGATSWMAPMIGAGTFMTPYQREAQMHERDKGSWMFSIEQEIPNPAKL